MKLHALTCACLVGLTPTTAAMADRSEPTQRATNVSHRDSAPAPLGWFAQWLKNAIDRAVAYATDPRDKRARS